MTRKYSLAVGFIVPALVAMACGGSDDSSGGGTGGSDAGASTGGKSGGSGGATATGGGTGTGGAAATCNLTPCEPFAQAPATACCVDATTCGVGAAGICFPVPEGGFPSFEGGLPFPDSGAFAQEPIVKDPACKDSSLSPIPGVTVQLIGCCDPTGVCGFTGQGFPTCLTTPEVATVIPQAAVDAGPPVKCHYPDGGITSEGGTPGTPDASVKDASAD